MSAMQPLCDLIGINSSKLSRAENLILEAEIFIRIYEELREIFRKQNKEYFRLMKLTIEKENLMIEKYLIYFMMENILTSEEYTLEGIARYTDTSEDLLQEIFITRNITPSVPVFRKIMELHRIVKPELYQAIAKKIASQYLEVA